MTERTYAQQKQHMKSVSKQYSGMIAEAAHGNICYCSTQAEGRDIRVNIVADDAKRKDNSAVAGRMSPT